MLAIEKLWTPDPIHWRTFRWKLLIVALGCVVVFYAERRVLVTVSASVEDRIFWRTGELPNRGDYATFSLSHPLAGPEPVQLTKRLTCWPGDELTLVDRVHACNGEALGRAKETGLNGQPLPLFVFNGVVPDGKAFAYGAHVDSFDSRYWGFVDIDTTERLYPLYGASR